MAVWTALYVKNKSSIFVGLSFLLILNRHYLPLQHLLSGNGAQLKRGKLLAQLFEKKISLCWPLPPPLYLSKSRAGWGGTVTLGATQPLRTQLFTRWAMKLHSRKCFGSLRRSLGEHDIWSSLWGSRSFLGFSKLLEPLTPSCQGPETVFHSLQKS